jgi:hypothetical protein
MIQIDLNCLLWVCIKEVKIVVIDVCKLDFGKLAFVKVARFQALLHFITYKLRAIDHKGTMFSPQF